MWNEICCGRIGGDPSWFMSAMSAFIIFRGLKNELLCTVNNDQQLGSSQNFASCKSFSDYTANEIQSMERLGVPTWLEYSYYPDLFFYWLTFWACYLLAEQVRIFECLMNVNKERFKIQWFILKSWNRKISKKPTFITKFLSKGSKFYNSFYIKS